MYENFDFKGFWKDNAESKNDFICKDASEEDIKKWEERLGFKLPKSYVELMSGHNGGLLGRTVFQMKNSDGRIKKSVICEFLNSISDRENFSLLSNWSRWTREDYHSGILIGLHMPNNGYGTRFYLDYSLCGSQGEPRVICHTSVWRNDNTQEIEFEVASTFEIFVKNLLKTPQIPPFDFESFGLQLAEVAKETFERMVKKYPNECFNAFGFYTNDEGSMVSTAMNTKEYLDNLTAKEPEEKEFYTYSTANWKYEGTNDSNECLKLSEILQEQAGLLFTDASSKNFRGKLIDCSVSALKNLKEQNYFKTTCGHEITLIVNLTLDDLSKSKLKKIISTLNA